MTVIVVVSGGRNYKDVDVLFRAMDRLDAKHNIAMVIEGASDDVTGPYVGVDYWVRQWALARGKMQTSVHANWKTEGRAAGPIRNRLMLTRYTPNLVIVFPGGRGTESMRGLAKKARVKIVKAFDWMVD